VNRISETIKQLFPDDFNEIMPSKRPWWQKFDLDALMSGWGLKLMSVAVAVFLLAGIYYWNRIIDLETNVITEGHQVDVSLQLRKDLFINLAKTVLDYAHHEREMFQYVVDQRGGGKGGVDQEKLAAFIKQNNITDISKIPADKLGGVLRNFNALAENYPQLRLNENFQTLMKALIDINAKITERRVTYNSNNNIYQTYIQQFPAGLYAFLFFQKKLPYIEVDSDVNSANRVAY